MHTTYDINVYKLLESGTFSGVSRIVDLMEDGGKLYVIEEYVNGKSLQDLLQTEGAVSEDKAIEYIAKLCDILVPFHELTPPIVHRDIKPSNIIVTSNDELVLIDFNTAKETDDTKSRDTQLIGTPDYAAPEQFGFGASRPTADIYAIGVLLNMLLTGELPGKKKYSGKLQAIIEKCTQMDPQNRYQSVLELKNAINGMPSKNKLPQKWRAWLPPGFRGKNPLVIIGAVIWYYFIFSTTLSGSFEASNGIGSSMISRICFCAMLILETLFVGNYRNIWSHLPLTSSKKKSLRKRGVALWIFVILFGLALIAVIIEDIFS